MTTSDVDVVVVGGGAAGIAAARRLRDASVRCLIVEARARLGGRAWTWTDPSGLALDLGCGWLHSADRNPLARIAEELGVKIDKTPPAWMRPSPEVGFPRAEQDEFRAALGTFFAHLEEAAKNAADAPASTLIDPDGRWSGLLNALATYISGVELDRFSIKDFDRYDDSGVNWRAINGYGALIARCGADLPALLDCPVSRIDHAGRRIRVETASRTITAEQVIVTIPTALIATDGVRFTPELPEKMEAALGLPLGLDDKLFMALEGAEEFEQEVRLFGHTDRAATGSYYFRPFGRPQIEAYFGGKLASSLEAEGEEAFFDFAVSELVGLFGSHFARRVKPVRIHCWGRDPFARGSYSSALPGFADCRLALASPVDDRLFFAGEACSAGDFSTAHGAWHTGVAAADAAVAVRGEATAKLPNPTLSSNC